MISCEQAKNQLVDYADDELPPAECREIERHLEACEACRTTLAALHESLRLAQVLWEDEAAEPALLDRSESGASCSGLQQVSPPCGTGFQPVEAGRLALRGGQRVPQETAGTEAGRYTGAAPGRAGSGTVALGRAGSGTVALGREGTAEGRCATTSPARSGLIAAALLLAVTGSLAWLLAPRTGSPPGTPPSVEQVILAVEREGTAAQMLAAAHLLAEQPGGWPYAVDQLQLITAAYPETTAAAGAKTMLSSSPERSVTQ